MPIEPLDRSRVQFHPLSDRENRVQIEEHAVSPDDTPAKLDAEVSETVARLGERILQAREADRPVMLAFGAHTIKNGLAPVLIHLMENDMVTHLATNGAGIIHDWEFAFQGETSEHVERNVQRGRFGAWEETGRYLNLAILLGAYRGFGYGKSVGSLIEDESLDVPSREHLHEQLHVDLEKSPLPARTAAAADLLRVMDRCELSSGTVEVKHPFKQYSAQAAALRLGVPLTGHPMFGHDIIYLHPLNCGPAIGRGAERDFLRFAGSVSEISGGVYMSVGSAVMSPMVFEKSMSMAQNLALQRGERIDDHLIVVNDIQESSWDWSRGEPPEDHPDYYLRFYKTFHRMGGELNYAQCDNRDFLLALCRELQ